MATTQLRADPAWRRAYNEARKVRNGAIDGRPAVIARCATPGDVAAALRLGRERDVADRGPRGGHTIAGVPWGELDAATQVHGLATVGGIVTHTASPASRSAAASAG